MRVLDVAGVAAWLCLSPLAACSSQAQQPLAVAARFPSLIDATIEQLTEGLESRLFTSEALTRAYLARIEDVNGTTHAVPEVNPDALAIAAALDEERASGHVRGPLHGIPILVKNNIATMDKMNNTSGSWLLVGATVHRDATTVRKLREAGAIILGKANLGEWAQARGTNVPSGWSPHGGQTYGAYHDRQDPGGSSSGSGVAADLGLAAAALGTETDGSIVFPSHMNNVVGIKPTVGLTSRHMVIPVLEHQDTVGPMARTVRDAATVLQAIVGVDHRDNYTSAIPFDTAPDYVAACRDGALRGARIGVPWNAIGYEKFGPVPSAQMAAFNESLAALRRAGAQIVPANFSSTEEDWSGPAAEARRTLGAADMCTDIPMYLAQLVHNPFGLRDLNDVIEKTKNHPLEGYPKRNTASLDNAAQSSFNNSDHRVWTAYMELQRIIGKGGVFGVLEALKLDALVMPSSIASPWCAPLGAPIVSVPMGYYPDDEEVAMDSTGELVTQAPGIPFGMSFMGRRWDEQKLIALAYGFESTTNIRGKQIGRVVQPKAEVCDFGCKRIFPNTQS